MQSSDNLKKIAEAVNRGETPQETVRTILSWFDAQRRGSWVVSTIRTALHKAGLVTYPDFESAYIDSLVEFRKRPLVNTGSLSAAVSPPTASGVGHVGAAPQIEATAGSPTPPVETARPFLPADPSFQLSKLAAANNVPRSVNPDACLEEAVTTMLANDFSQLPIMQNARDVLGAISWRSIASRLATGKTGTFVREFADSVEVVDSTASLFDAVASVIEHQYILVRAPDKRIVGIITSSDLSAQFKSLTEPFLLLSEVENDVRRIIQSKFQPEDLSAAKDPADSSRIIGSVYDMTFGEYIRLLENQERWQKLSIKLDRKAFMATLSKVRDIRNDVMHFDPDGIPTEDLEVLRNFAAFLARLRSIGVT